MSERVSGEVSYHPPQSARYVLFNFSCPLRVAQYSFWVILFLETVLHDAVLAQIKLQIQVMADMAQKVKCGSNDGGIGSVYESSRSRIAELTKRKPEFPDCVRVCTKTSVKEY